MSLDPSPYYRHHSQKGPKSENPLPPPPQHISNTVFEQTTSSKVGNSRGSQSLSLCDSCLCPPFHDTRRSSSCTLYKPMDSDEGARVESSAGAELAAYEGDTVLEPYEGMEFESEDSAKIFYDEYARRLGFVMRVMSCRRSERDGKILARRLGCNKEGHCVSIRGKFGPVRKPRPSTREGCKAMIHVKYDKSGKWVITKFVKDHNHPLVVSPREARQTMDEKDKKIQELTAELRNKKRLCATYQEQLNAFMKMVEEHSEQISKKVQNVVDNLKEFESIEQDLLRHR